MKYPVKLKYVSIAAPFKTIRPLSVGIAYLYNGSKPQLIDDEVSDLLMIG